MSATGYSGTLLTKWAGALVAIIALAGASSGCKGLVPATTELPLWVHHPGDALSVRMKRPLRDADRAAEFVPERSIPAIDPVHRRVFVGSSDHGLYALRAVDGSSIWRFETAGAVASEILYLSLIHI